ncbi:MAG: TonB-dependent receptor, partial [Xanthomonadales bacterium]|nr:TonB-dependent receptor [Xanthomonadales bacterium]
MMKQNVLIRPVSTSLKATWILLLFVLATLISMPLMAQQSGDIAGRITDAADGTAIADVSISATSPTLPGTRSATTSANGDYLLPLLPPGVYTVTYTLKDGSTRIRQTEVLLQQRAIIDLAIDYSVDESMLEEVIVVGTSTLDSNTGGAAITAAISNDLFEALPVGQEYRDLIKLIPGVQYTEDTTRGPSAGGSGQDNTYQFDGVDVSLPMFGTLSAEPSTHDIDQVSIIRGGAKAIGFNRSGGVTVNTISKSGTDEFHGSASYQTQTSGMTSDRKNDSAEDFDQDRSWITANIGGPIIKEKLYFYGSYYRPEVKRDNASNAYGDVPNYKSVRNEYFAKLTYAPTDNFLLDASYRTSKRTVENDGVDEFEAATLSEGDEAKLRIGIVEASWIISDRSSSYFKYTNFENKTGSLPDTLFDFDIAVGDSLDVNNLDQQGRFNVPVFREGEDDYNAFAQPLIDKYGFVENGMKMGGGAVGGGSTINSQDFYRESFELGYDIQFDTGSVSHEMHVGYHTEKIEEDLSRTSNGWGSITAPGGRTDFNDVPIYYEARFEQMSLLDESGNMIPPIHSETRSQNIEINDTMYVGDWTFNIGLLFSQDKLYGEGLKRNPLNYSGFEQALGNRYMMKKIKFGDMIQPRLGAIWDINDRTSMFANYARYYPSASSLSRAASWGRNLRRSIRAYFNEDGTFIDVDPVRSSSGKVFQEGIDPRHIDEYLLGVTYQFTDRLTGRAHVRYRAARDFWEDTNNTARINPNYGAPDNIPKELYVEDLARI